MLLIEYLLNCARRLIEQLNGIAHYFGRHIFYETFEDCYKWADHLSYIFGIYIMHRKEIKSNRIKYFKKTGYALYLTKCIAIGNIFLISVMTYIYGCIQLTKYTIRSEIVHSLMFISNAFADTMILYIIPSYGLSLEKLIDLHFETDELLKQLHVPVDYSLAMICNLTVQVVVYGYVSICTSCGVYEFLINENNNRFVIFYEYLMIAVTILTLLFIFIQHVGNLLICLVRSWRINHLLRKSIYNDDIDDDIGDIDDIDAEINDDHKNVVLYKSRSMNILFQLVIDFHHKQNAIAKTTLDFTAFINLIMAFIYSADTAFIIYCYFYDSVLKYKVFSTYLLFTIGILINNLAGELFIWQAQKTVNIISDWTICYLDEEFIQNKNSLLLQTIHNKWNEQYDGIIKVNSSLWIMITELALTILVYIIQTFDTQ